MIHPYLCPECGCSVSAPGATCHRCQSKAESKFVFLACFALAAFILIGVASCRGASVVTPEFISWVEQRESGGNPKAVGKAGELGSFQLMAIAVKEVNRLTGSTWRHSDAKDRAKARIIATQYLLICQDRCRVKTRESVYRKYRGLK